MKLSQPTTDLKGSSQGESLYALQETDFMKNERGIAMLMALVVISLLSIVGVSAMRGSTLERQLVSNAVQARDVFQAAESANEAALNAPQTLSDTFNAPDQVLVLDADIRAEIGLESQSTVRFVGEGNATGASLNAMQGANSFDALRFVAEGVAKIDSIHASRRIDQGATRIVPAN